MAQNLKLANTTTTGITKETQGERFFEEWSKNGSTTTNMQN
jgi:hypothetical protein